MSGQDKLIAIYLRRLDNRLERIEDDITAVRRRLGQIEETGAVMASNYAAVQVRMDRIESRLDRMDRRAERRDSVD